MGPKTALLVIDMQNVFRLMVTTAGPNIEKLCKYFSERSWPIIFTQHGHSKEELTTNPSPNQLVRKWGPDGSIATGSRNWELMLELTAYLPKPGSNTEWPKLVPKNTYDAFINTPLESILSSAGIERVVVCGVMTDCCVDTTARSAFNRGFETWVVRDACASANKRQHEAGLSGFGFAFGEVLGWKAVVERLENEDGKN